MYQNKLDLDLDLDLLNYPVREIRVPSLGKTCRHRAAPMPICMRMFVFSRPTHPRVESGIFFVHTLVGLGLCVVYTG